MQRSHLNNDLQEVNAEALVRRERIRVLMGNCPRLIPLDARCHPAMRDTRQQDDGDVPERLREIALRRFSLRAPVRSDCADRNTLSRRLTSKCGVAAHHFGAS